MDFQLNILVVGHITSKKQYFKSINTLNTLKHYRCMIKYISLTLSSIMSLSDWINIMIIFSFVLYYMKYFEISITHLLLLNNCYFTYLQHWILCIRYDNDDYTFFFVITTKETSSFCFLMSHNSKCYSESHCNL